MKKKTLFLESYNKFTNARQLQNKLSQLEQQDSIHIYGPLLKCDTPIKAKLPIFIDKVPFDLTADFILLGDADSTAAEFEKYYDYLLPKSKDFTDFEAFIELINRPLKTKSLCFHGFWGGRFDHWNIILCQISDYLLHHPMITYANFYDEREKLILQILNTGQHQFNEQIPFSLMTPYTQKISLQGKISYAGEIELSAWSGHGLSNQSLGPWSIDCHKPIWKYFL